MPQLSIRSFEPELMDQPGVAVNEIRQTLRELETVNKLLGGYNTVLKALKKIHWPDRKVTILDVGCGGGDMLRSIADWAKNNHKKVTLVGVDWNPVMTEYAAEHSSAYPNIEFRTINVFDNELMELHADITTCSLFCHHFDDEHLVVLIKRMYALAGNAVIINDLNRHWLAYYSIKLLTRIFSKTYLVKYDAPLSVARAFTRKELKHILQMAEIDHYKLSWKWAWRWELIIEKQSNK